MKYSISLLRFAACRGITDHEHALSTAVATGLTICKYADALDGARDGLSVDEALDLAREDASLVYLTLSAQGGQ